MYEDEVHQIECRWVQGRDVSPIASSYPGHSDLAQRWFDVLRGMVWPTRPNPASGAPEASVAYLMLENQMAALMWRQWTIDAISLGESSSGRRPLATRILVGNQQLLSPETAIALCRAGLHSLSVPPLGQVTPGTQLSPIVTRDLSGLAAITTYTLDDGARHEPGLHRLISAALRDRRTPLSVQLPPEEMGEPGKGSQVPLLWGLWCTTALLLAGAGGAGDEGRSWSFSTYEQPFHATQTSGLADLVFRVRQPALPAPVVRSEITVLPRGPAAHSDMDAYDELAVGLAEAYRTLGGFELASRLGAVTGEPDFLDRLDGARLVLAEFMPCRPVRSAPDSIVMEPMAAPENGPLPPARYPVSPELEDFPVAADTTTAAEIGEQPDPQRAVRYPAHAPRHSTEGAHARQNGAEDAQGIAGVIDSLAAGPAEPGFRQALAVLHGQMARPSPQDRADARNYLAQCGWCIPELTAFDPRRVEYTLEALFSQAVIPDLVDPACQLEMASWAYERMAPTAVIRSLVAAAYQAGQDQAQSLDDALQPALHRRWLVEHAVYYGASPQISAGRVQWAQQRERPPWQIFVAGPRSAAVASILVWVCILLILALVFVLAR